MLRSIVAPSPARLDLMLLVRQLAGVGVAVAPEDVSAGPEGLTLLYEAAGDATAAILAVVAAHAPPRKETEAERVARLAKESDKAQAPTDLALLAFAYMVWSAVTPLYQAHNDRRARDESDGKDVSGVPVLVAFASFAECLAYWKGLIDLIASGQLDPAKK